MKKIRLKWLIIYIVILCIVVPGCVKVEFIGTEPQANYRSVMAAVSKGVYSVKDGLDFGEEPMKYNYPDTLFTLIPLWKYVFEANNYQYIIRNNIGGGTLNRTFSDVRIYYGALKLYEINADELAGHIAGTDAFYIDEDRNISFAIDDGGEVSFTLNGIRKPVIINIILLYFGMVIVGIILYLLDRKNNLITNAIERLQEYILEIFRTIRNKRQIIKRYCINLLIAAIIVLVVNKVFLAFDIKGLIEREEVDCLIFACAIICTYLSFHAENRRTLCLSALCVTIGMSFSILYMTSYFNVDEKKAIDEQLSLQSDILRHWYMQNAHTNYLIMGTFFKAIPSGILEGLSISSRQFVKIVHWFMGCMVVHLIVVFAGNHFFKERKNILLSLVSCYTAMFLLPVFALAMSNFNYDLFSCIFSVFAVVVIWYAYEVKNIHYASIAVILCTLAAQEKILVIPMLFVISVLWLDIYCSLKGGKGWKADLLGSAYVIFIQIGVLIFTHWWVLSVLLKGEASWIESPILKPLLQVEMSAIEKISGSENVYLISAGAILILWFGLIVVRRIYGIIKKIVERERVEVYFVRVCSVLILLYYLVGIAFTRINIEEYTANDNILYLVKYIINFVVAFPTFFLLISAVWLVWEIYTGKISWFRMFMLFFLTYVMAGLYTIMGEYNQSRLMNVYIMAYLVVQVILILLSIESSGKEISRIKKNVVLLGLVLTLVEVFPSIKLGFKIFNPYWAPYQILNNGRGTFRAWYGRELLEYCEAHDIDVNTISIYTAYSGGSGGEWNDNYAQIPFYRFADIQSLDAELLSDKVFYCVERELTGRDLGDLISPIDEVEPILYVKYRGMPVAYIYRGDQLKDFWASYVVQ